MLTRVAVGRVVGLPIVHRELEACTDNLTVDSMSIDAFPFVGDIPNRDGQFVAAGFSGHGTFCLYEIGCQTDTLFSRHAPYSTIYRPHHTADSGCLERQVHSSLPRCSIPAST